MFLPFEIISDLGNNGIIDDRDRALKLAAQGEDANEDEIETAIEYMFVNDNLSNGVWDKDDPNSPDGYQYEDDAEKISVTCLATWGAIWFEHPAIDSISFYKSRECLEKIDFPFALSEQEEGRIQEDIFLRVDMPGVTEQVAGDLIMRWGSFDKSEVWSSDKIKLVIVNQVGDSMYFNASRDYMLEQNSRIHIRYFRAGRHEVRVTAMRHESTQMGVIETYHRDPKIYGMRNVVSHNQDYYDLIMNANFCFFNGGMAGRVLGIRRKSMTPRCHGGAVANRLVNPATSVGGDSPFEQADAEYLSSNGKGTIEITTGIVPLDPPEHQAALGDFASNLVGEPYSIHPWFGIAEIGSGKNKNKILATISQTSGLTVYPVAELMERLSGSGVPELPGSGGHIMMVAGDGGTSNAVAYRIEGDETKVKYLGANCLKNRNISEIFNNQN